MGNVVRLHDSLSYHLCFGILSTYATSFAQHFLYAGFDALAHLGRINKRAARYAMQP
jgi:hypothetical protein